MRRLFTLLMATLLVAACSEKEGEVYYTALYPITRVEVEVNLASADEQLETEVREAVLAESPVAEGGCYRLEYNRFDGGLLYVQRETGADYVAGEFDKTPAARTMTFRLGEEQYTVTSDSYVGDNGFYYATLTVDLSAQYHAQNESIMGVKRIEYTTYLLE